MKKGEKNRNVDSETHQIDGIVVGARLPRSAPTSSYTCSTEGLFLVAPERSWNDGNINSCYFYFDNNSKQTQVQKDSVGQISQETDGGDGLDPITISKMCPCGHAEFEHMEGDCERF